MNPRCGPAAKGRAPGWQRAWGLTVLLGSLLLGGCASVGPGGPAAAADPAGSVAPATAASATPPAAAETAAPTFELITPQEYEQQSPTLGVQLDIQAPEPLRRLLAQHLDLVRLGNLPDGDADDSEWARLIDATPAQVRSLLQTEGYFAPEVHIQRSTGRASGQPDRVQLRVEPGPRAKVTRLQIEVQGDLERGASQDEPHASATLAALRAGWELPLGSDFRNPAWNEAKASALARLRAAGYAAATWAGTGAQVDTARHEVHIFVVAESGPLFRWGSLEIEGLVAHDAQTLGHLMNARRGVPVTETLMLDFQERLLKSGLFENVSVTLDPDPQRADAARITTRVRETPLQVYTFGVGVSANTGPRASVEHLYRRVFGFPVTSRVKIEAGRLRQAWDAELSTHPGRGLWRNLLGGAVERLESNSDVVLAQRLRVGRAQDAPRLERLFFAEAERSLRRPVSGTESNAFSFTLNFHGGWRNLDNVILPTDGETLALQLGAGRSHGTDARSGYYGRTYGRLTVYRPLGRTWYGLARLEAGQVHLRPGMVVPESQKWRVGGDDSVRGYGYRSLGPVQDGAVGSGTAMMTTSVELARPISADLPSVWGAVFVDAGNAADSFRAIDPVVGFGVGVRWRSPVGPLRVDWAWARDTRKGRLHFSVGIAF